MLTTYKAVFKNLLLLAHLKLIGLINIISQLITTFTPTFKKKKLKQRKAKSRGWIKICLKAINQSTES